MKELKVICLFLLIALLAACARGPEDTRMRIVQSYTMLADPIDFAIGDNVIFVAEGILGLSLWNKATGEEIRRIGGPLGTGTEIRNVSLVRYYASHNLLVAFDRDGSHSMEVFEYRWETDDLRYITSAIGSSNSVRDFVLESIDATRFRTFWGHFALGAPSVQTGILDLSTTHISHTRETIPSTINSMVLTAGHVISAVGQRGIFIQDRNLNFVSTCDTPVRALDLEVRNNIVYVADGQGGLQIIDISDINEPQIVNSVTIEGNAVSLDLSDRYLALGTSNGGVYLFDISSPANPKLLDRLRFNQVGYLFKVKFYRNELFVASREFGIIRIRIN